MKVSKKFYILSAVFIILFSIYLLNLSYSKEVIKSGSDITMYIASDIHYLDKILTDNSEGYKEYAITRDGKQLFYMEEIMDAFASDIKDNTPDILIVSGDLTNNGEIKNHIELSKRFNDIEKSGTDVYVIPGNHDLMSMWARGYKNGTSYPVENIDHVEFEKIYKDFGYEESISRDKKTLSYLAAPSEDIWLLMIDSNQYMRDFGMPTNNGFVTDETIEWIKDCSQLADEKNAEIIAVMHHPLMTHSSRIKDGTSLSNSNSMMELFKELNIRIIFSGHIHIQDIQADDVINPKIYDIVDSALSVYPQQYGVLKYSPVKGYEYSKAKVNVEKWANDQDLTDPNLLGFNQYSKESFGSRTYHMAVEELTLLDAYSEKEIEEMAQMIKDLNLRYFEGTIQSIKKELFNSPTYKLFLDTKSEYLYDFVYSMVHDVKFDSSKLILEK